MGRRLSVWQNGTTVSRRLKGEFHDHPALPDSAVGDFMETECE